MADTAAHLVENVLPEQPIRQWVLSFPYPLRFLFATRPAVLSQVLDIVYRAISTFLIRRAGLRVGAGARTGAVTRIRRLGSAFDLNVHLHMLFVDGVYTFKQAQPRFHHGSAPTRPELQRLLRTIATRVTRALEGRGLLIRDEENPALDLEPADGFEQLLGAAVHYRIATGPHAGRKALTLHTVSSKPPADNSRIAQLSGFSVIPSPARHSAREPHASRRAPMSWMQRLERVFRIDIEHCGVCSGTLRVIACVETKASCNDRPRAPPLHVAQAQPPASPSLPLS